MSKLFSGEVRDYLTKAEVRFTCPVVVDKAEVRSEGGLALRGHAAVFFADSEPIFGMFTERIARGAFRKSLATNPDVRFLFNHEGQPIARTKNGTLRLREDNTGLAFEADIADTTLGRDIHKLVERGDLDQMSFAFTVARDQWSYSDGDGLDERTIYEIGDVFEVSAVTFPAYPTTDVATKTVDAVSGDRSNDSESEQAVVGAGEQRDEQADSDRTEPSPDQGAVDMAQRLKRLREIDILERRLHDGSPTRTSHEDSERTTCNQ